MTNLAHGCRDLFTKVVSRWDMCKVSRLVLWGADRLCFSEIRLLEIMEGLCDTSDFECNQLLEQQEERLEEWWQTL